jgi:hypothetical protein
MAVASPRGARPRRAMAFAFLTLLGLLAARPAVAQGTKPPASTATQEIVAVIDEHIKKGWEDNKLTPSADCTDSEFLRRASLDIIGRIATVQEYEEYVKDSPKERRRKLIDRLLAHEEYAKNWANLWANWLLSRTGQFGRGRYHDQTVVWLEDQFSLNKPYSEIVKKLITARGTNDKDVGPDNDGGAVNFILAHLGEANPPMKRREEGQYEMVPITARITRLFLGVQTQCTQCHDHPFDNKLKQEHFWGVNVFLRQVERDPAPMNNNQQMMTTPSLTLKENRDANPEGMIVFEKRNGVFLTTKAFLLDKKDARLPTVDDMEKEGRSRREYLADFILANDQFPKAMVNRMWAHFFGRGFVNPIDDFNDQNAPSHPELLDEMAKKFRHYNFNQKELIRWITLSKPYQLAAVANRTNATTDAEPFFSRMLLKAMSPEQLFESIMTATMYEAGTGKDARRNLRNEWMNRLINNFGDDEGNEVSFNGTVVQALLMMNGNDINAAIGDGSKGAIAEAFRKGKTMAQAIDELYKMTLNRTATAKEKTMLTSKLTPVRRDEDMKGRFCDLLWALLNSNEFMLNH